MTINEDLLTTDQAATALALSPRSLSQYRYIGLGPNYVRVGKRSIRYRLSDLARYVEEITPPAVGMADLKLRLEEVA